MTTHSPHKKTLLRQLGNLLTGDRKQPLAADSADSRNQPKALETNVVLPFSPPPVFIDYAAEGDEPADLALIELIPTGLKSLNLPYASPASATKPAQFSEPNHQPNNTCHLIDRPTSLEAMNQAVVAAELTDLTPLELTSLNIAPQKSRSQKLAAIAPKPQASSLEQNQTHQSADYQSSHQPVAERPINDSQINDSQSFPLPDLATLRRAPQNSKMSSEIDTIRIPTAYLDNLEQIVEGLLRQQNQQSRHNEQLGALVKQLLGRIAQQQIELSRLGKDDQGDIQQMIQTCLTSH